MIRKSVPSNEAEGWWQIGWSYVMPDFDNTGHSIIEWRSDKAPVEPNRVPASQQTEDANGSEHRT